MIEVVYALWRRDMIKFLRDRRQLVTSLSRSFIWLLAFGLGLRSSVRIPAGGADYVSFLVPGLAAMTVLFGSMFAAISIVWEREFGFLKELLVAPVPRGAIVAAKILAGSATALIETVVMLLLSPLVGARFNPLGALASLPLLVLFGMTVNALGIIVAARMKSFEGFGAVVNFVIQPVFFLSGALYPIAGLPRGLRAIVLVNPMTYVVDAVRGLCIGHHAFPLLLSTAVVVVSALILAALATRSFSRMEA
ncbi:MAG TPA: ABC transporter permease [Polyangia bacterium]|nr:ABC transporter permease [Polyangia bacterium]